MFSLTEAQQSACDQIIADQPVEHIAELTLLPNPPYFGPYVAKPLPLELTGRGLVPRNLNRRVMELSRSYRWKVFAGITAVAAAVTVPATVYYQSLSTGAEGFTHRDPSILPGDGHDIWLGSLIPGLNDLNAGTIVVPRVVEQKQATLSATAASGKVNSKNPYAPTFELTGQEYPNDQAVAKQLLDSIQGIQGQNKQITVSIIGMASDESQSGNRANLGVSDPKNLALADARAEVASQALQDEARARNLDVKVVEVNGTEAVLSNDQIASIAQLAAEKKLSIDEIISLYNDGKLESPLLDELLAKNRFARYDAHIAYSIESAERVTKRTEVPAHFPQVPGEIVLTVGAAIMCLGAAIVPSREAVIRAAKRKLGKQNSKAL